jgi:hypothetical protein
MSKSSLKLGLVLDLHLVLCQLLQSSYQAGWCSDNTLGLQNMWGVRGLNFNHVTGQQK